MKRFSIQLLLLLLPTAYIATASDGPTLTLAAALERAVENNPALLAQRHSEHAAAALIEQAGVRPNPTLEAELENFLGTGEVRGVRGVHATAMVSQTLERGGKRARRVAFAESERDIIVQELAVQRIELLARTAAAFTETLAAQERLALAEEPLNLARATLASVEKSVEGGMASSVDVARASVGAAAAKAEHARARAGWFAARAALAATWGGKPEDVGAVGGHVPMPETVPDQETLRAGLRDHPRVKLQEAQVATRRAALALAEAQAAQDITVEGGVRFIREGTDAAFVAGVSIPLPVRDRNQGNIRAARESLTGAELATRAVESELRAAFLASWHELETAHATAVGLQHDALPAAEEAHRVVRRAYEEGQLALSDVLDAQRALVAIRREILDAGSAYALALARVESLANPAFTHTAAFFASE